VPSASTAKRNAKRNTRTIKDTSVGRSRLHLPYSADRWLVPASYHRGMRGLLGKRLVDIDVG
jgi:hypothetical protein